MRSRLKIPFGRRAAAIGVAGVALSRQSMGQYASFGRRGHADFARAWATTRFLRRLLRTWVARYWFGLSLLTLWAGCAPLTPPVSEPSPPAGSRSGDATPPPVPALAPYLHQREMEADSSAAMRPYIAILPFIDQSGFRQDIWDVKQEMARLLSQRMSGRPDWHIVPYEAVVEVVGDSRKWKPEKIFEIGNTLKADMVLEGILKDYNMGRLSVGDPMLGGYKSYSGVAEIELKVLRVSEQNELGTVQSRQETVDRDVGLDLLGKPRKQDIQFATLRQVPFGSEEFQATPIGEATLTAMDELIVKVMEMLRPSGFRLSAELAEILSVFGEEVYVNLGNENGLNRGYRFEVYPGPERAFREGLDTLQRLGIVEIQEVIGARLSRVRVLEGKGQIQPKDRLKLVESAPEEPNREKESQP